LNVRPESVQVDMNASIIFLRRFWCLAQVPHSAARGAGFPESQCAVYDSREIGDARDRPSSGRARKLDEPLGPSFNSIGSKTYVLLAGDTPRGGSHAQSQHAKLSVSEAASRNERPERRRG
jgi:hypothetical protein